MAYLPNDAPSIDLSRSIDDVFSVPEFGELYSEWQEALSKHEQVIVIGPSELNSDDRDNLPRAIHNGVLRAKSQNAPIRTGDIAVIFGHAQLIESVDLLRKDELRAILMVIITSTYRRMKELRTGRGNSVQDILEITAQWSSKDRLKLIRELELQDGKNSSDEATIQAHEVGESGLANANFSAALRLTSKEIIEHLKSHYGFTQQRIANEISTSRSQISDIVREKSTPSELILLAVHDLWSRAMEADKKSGIPDFRQGGNGNAGKSQVSSELFRDKEPMVLLDDLNERALIDRLVKSGLEQREIAEKTGSNSSTISRIFARKQRSSQGDLHAKLVELMTEQLGDDSKSD